MRYFGTASATGGTAPASNSTIRSYVEKDYNTVKRSHASYDPSLHIFPGDLIPAGKTYLAGEAYTQSTDVICKVFSMKAVKYLSNFETRSEFFNPRSHTTNQYLVWGFAKPALIKDAVCVTMKKVAA